MTKRQRPHYCKARCCWFVTGPKKPFCAFHFNFLPQDLRTLKSDHQILSAIEHIAEKEHQDRVRAIQEAQKAK
jgi:hypothetical protein